MLYSFPVQQFNYHRLADNMTGALSPSGSHIYLNEVELSQQLSNSVKLPLERLTELRSKFFLAFERGGHETRRLLKSRQATKREAIQDGSSLHIFVSTVQYADPSKYCQISRSLSDFGQTISLENLNLG